MAEEEQAQAQTPVEAPAPVVETPVVEAPKTETTPEVSQEEIKIVEQEIETQDNEKLKEVKTQLNSEFKAELQRMREEMESQYSAKMSEQIKAVKEAYDEKITNVEGKLEDIKSRKGIVSTPTETPYEEIQKAAETPIEANNAVKKDPFSINSFSRTEIEATGEAFLSNLRK